MSRFKPFARKPRHTSILTGQLACYSPALQGTATAHMAWLVALVLLPGETSGVQLRRRCHQLTFNARADDGAFRHALDNEPGERLIRAGSVADYLVHERVELVRKLATFVADTTGALGI